MQFKIKNNIFKLPHIFCKWNWKHPKYPNTLVCTICGRTKIKVGEYIGIAADGDNHGIPIYEEFDKEPM